MSKRGNERDNERGFDDVDEASSLLGLHELARALALAPEWLVERVQAGLIEVTLAAGGSGAASADIEAWRFDAVVVRRVRSMRHTETCYGAVPELAALVADLEEEIAALRLRATRLPP